MTSEHIVIKGNTIVDSHSALGGAVRVSVNGYPTWVPDDRPSCLFSWRGFPCALASAHGEPHQLVCEQPQLEAIDKAMAVIEAERDKARDLGRELRALLQSLAEPGKTS